MDGRLSVRDWLHGNDDDDLLYRRCRRRSNQKIAVKRLKLLQLRPVIQSRSRIAPLSWQCLPLEYSCYCAVLLFSTNGLPRETKAAPQRGYYWENIAFGVCWVNVLYTRRSALKAKATAAGGKMDGWTDGWKEGNSAAAS